jgi:crossover junction endodeoxyribonuclease RuvC
MRILGFDPGSRVTGYGCIERVGYTYRYIASGCIRLPAAALEIRLQQLCSDIAAVLDEYQPTVVALERIFVGKNLQGSLQLAHARGVIVAAIGTRQLPLYQYSAREVKLAVSGSGAAGKGQVQTAVQLLLQLSAAPANDAADALAVAICHGNKTGGVT